MEKNGGALVVIAAVIALAGSGVALLWGPLATPSDPALPIRIGIQPSEASTPFFVADERGLFGENGLNVTMRPYSTEERAIAAAEADDVDVALPTEYPVVLAAMSDEAYWMIANTLTFATTTPDFREYVDTTALARVNPHAVTIS